MSECESIIYFSLHVFDLLVWWRLQMIKNRVEIKLGKIIIVFSVF